VARRPGILRIQGLQEQESLKNAKYGVVEEEEPQEQEEVAGVHKVHPLPLLNLGIFFPASSRSWLCFVRDYLM
jgi:hypothetical protein